MKRLLTCVALSTVLGCAATEEDLPPLDGTAHYVVAITSASISPTNNGASWDDVAGFEAPDVFCEFGDGTTYVSTAAVQDSYAPTWATQNAIDATVAFLRSGNLTVQLWDADALLPDQITSVGALTFTDDQIRSGSYAIGSWDGANSITFAIAPAAQ
jgi:hypothetical protein